MIVCESQQDLIDYTKIQLGGEFREIEISPSQWEIIITQAIEKIQRVSRLGKFKYYYSTTIDKEKNKKNGAYIVTLPEDIYSINNVYHFDRMVIDKEFDYFIENTTIFNNQFDFVSHWLLRNHLEIIKRFSNNQLSFEFNKITKEITLDLNKDLFSFQTRIIIECMKVVNDDNERIFNFPWIKEYVEALAYIRWASNISKYDRSLHGDTTLNWQELKETGEKKKEELELELDERYARPPLIVVK